MSSWFQSAIQSVRDKSFDALDFVRRDLNEFTTTVKSDTETYLNKVKTQDVGDLGINRFVSKLSGSIRTDNEDGKHIHATPSFDRIHNELARLQNDESTYLTDPTPIEAYETWRQTTNFNIDARKGDIAQVLIDAPHVRLYYARFVPAQTTHVDFWSRYYYRVHLIEEEEVRRTQLLRRAHEMCSENNENTNKDTENDWDEPDEELSKEPPIVIQKSTQEIAPMEKQESIQETHTIESQEPVIEKTDLETTSPEGRESDATSGDSWEREFDETDVVSSAAPIISHEDQLIKSSETVNIDSLSSSTVTTTSTIEPSSTPTVHKRVPNEFDDEWESWS